METTTHTPAPASTNRLERPIQGRVLAGVAAGIAQRANISVGLTRLGFIIASLFGGFGVLLYLAAWALMPEEGVEEAPAERWFANLNNPDRRTGAILIGIAGAIVIVSLAPITAIAVVALVIGAAVLAADKKAERGTEEPTLGENVEPDAALDDDSNDDVHANGAADAEQT
ncbi:MAG: PspC domain-containing protein [Acidimicrobiia bacterium]|nr:PspC domain-containing protein [Acidimicrobiia bacterium]